MATKVITTFVSLILTLNNFVLSCKIYTQIKCCAMGTTCASCYANKRTHHFERKHLSPFLQALSLIYLRFIHDIFFIWTGILDELNTKDDFAFKI